MTSEELDAIRRRFVVDSQTELRRPAVAVGTGLVFVVLGLAPLVPAGRALFGVPFAYTAIWATLYLALSAIMYVWCRRGGTGSRAYWIMSAIETASWLYGVIILGGATGALVSPWLVLMMLGFLALAASSGFSDRPQVVVVAGTPIVTIASYAPLGIETAAAACLVTLLGCAAFGWLGATVERFLREQAQREGLQARVAQLERDLERQHIARDLHDSMGSTLSLIGAYSTLIEQKADRPDELRELARMLRDASSEGLDELRGVLDAVAPAEPTVGGLVTNVERLIARVPEPTIASLRVDAPTNLALDPLVRTALLRVFQEAMTNAIRHGRARTIETRIALAGEQLVLSIRDDGSGFDPAAPRSGRGLVGMRERASELGGHLQLDAAVGRGTQVRFEVPRVRGG
jgi:signal transduction histidine kinase